MKVSLVCAFAAVCLVFSPHASYPCSCASTTPGEQLAVSDAVFTGRVISVETVEGQYGNEIRRAVVQVEALWKGDFTGRFLVDTSPRGSCLFTLFADQDYLIYASRNASGDGAYWTHECNRTRSRREAEDDIRALGEPIFVLGVDTSTWGKIKSLYN